MKKESERKILSFIELKPRRWNEISKEFNITKPTLIRYINDLIKKEYVTKTLINNKDHYVIWKLPKEKKAEVIKDLEKAIELFEHLKELGLFSKGITDKEILEIMKNTKFMSFGSPFPDVDIKKLDLIRLVEFLSKALFTLTHYLYSGVEVKLKIEGNPEEEIKDLQERIKSLKANKQKYF